MTNINTMLDGLTRDNIDQLVPVTDDTDLELSDRGRRGRRRRNRPPLHYYPRFRRRRHWHRRRYYVYPGRGLASFLFGMGVGALATSTLSSTQQSYEGETDERMIPCGKLPRGIEIQKDTDGNPVCANLEDGSLVCFYEIKKGDPKACFVKPE